MELLSPAGSPEALLAAVQNGADAVYMGLGSFNARRSARNFTDDTFPQAVDYCHRHGVKVYLTLNTLLTDRELPEAAETLRKASAWGVDAVLVQDWGLWLLARQVAPDQPVWRRSWAWSGWCWPGSFPPTTRKSSAATAERRWRCSATEHCVCATPASAP